jgi:hypothetical protein
MEQKKCLAWFERGWRAGIQRGLFCAKYRKVSYAHDESVEPLALDGAFQEELKLLAKKDDPQRAMSGKGEHE